VQKGRADDDKRAGRQDGREWVGESQGFGTTDSRKRKSGVLAIV
jgi:hypothetical protein